MAQLDLTYPAILQLFGGHLMKGRTEARAFLAWFLENYYRLEETEAADCICDGRHDKGVDGIYVNEQIGQIDVFQGSVAQGKKTLGDTALKEFAGSLSQFKSGDSIRNVQATTKNADLARILKDESVAKKVDEGYEVRGVYITNATRDHNAIDFLNITPGIVLYDEIELQRGYVSPDRVGPIEREISFDISTVPHMFYGIGTDMEMVIAPIPASELVQMDGIVSGELFAWNVRQWLGKKTKVNRDIELSIQKPAEHRYFPAFHNGLTILCENLDVSDDAVKISSYAVVNGCQSLTGLYGNSAYITSDLKILTKFIRIAPDSELALKITDHANNQNGTTGRDLKSNNPIQTRLQSEIHSKYKDEVYYRIKRGESPDWPPEKVIENDLAARILLAFDLKQPWTCHQTYKLFQELHGSIFGRPQVTADRIVALNDILLSVVERLKRFENEMFAEYGLTKYLLLYLVSEALETDPLGKAFCVDPAAFMHEPNGRERLKYAMNILIEAVGGSLDTEITLRNEPVELTHLFEGFKEAEPFDYKRQLKNPRPVRELRSRVISDYQFLVVRHKQNFTHWWNESEQAVQPGGQF
jgi:hypothetical protein